MARVGLQGLGVRSHTPKQESIAIMVIDRIHGHTDSITTVVNDTNQSRYAPCTS